jgi:hypothetical protein
VVPRRGSMTARFLPDPGAKVSDLAVSATPAEGKASRTTQGEGYYVDEQARSTGFYSLTPGVWDLTVRLLSYSSPVPMPILQRIEGIRVPSGEAATDSRLEGIDLRGKLSALTLTVLNAEGRPVADAIWNGDSISDSEGRLRIFGSPPWSGTIIAPGYAPTHLPAVDRDQAVRLGRGTTYRGSVAPQTWSGLLTAVRNQAKRASGNSETQVSIQPVVRLWPSGTDASDRPTYLPTEGLGPSGFTCTAEVGAQLSLELKLQVGVDATAQPQVQMLAVFTPARIQGSADGTRDLPPLSIDMPALLRSVEAAVLQSRVR